jgi:hypothetical protein
MQGESQRGRGPLAERDGSAGLRHFRASLPAEDERHQSFQGNALAWPGTRRRPSLSIKWGAGVPRVMFLPEDDFAIRSLDDC